MAFFIGVDAGGSHGRARLVDSTGSVIGTGEAGSANARIGLEALRAILLDVAGQAVRAAGLDPTEAASVRAGFGVAGMSRPGLREALSAMPMPFATAAWDTDAAAALLGAHGGADGAILILGTGSIALARVGGREFRIGGYGFPTSDEGSGAALGFSAMRHALRGLLDGRTRATPLSAAVTGRFDHDSIRAVAWMDAATPRDYAAFAPLVMDHAEADDAIARSIVEEAALHVELFVETTFERGAERCAILGSLSARMRPWLRQRTTARLSEPEGDALDGALRLAGYRAR